MIWGWQRKSSKKKLKALLKEKINFKGPSPGKKNIQKGLCNCKEKNKFISDFPSASDH